MGKKTLVMGIAYRLPDVYKQMFLKGFKDGHLVLVDETDGWDSELEYGIQHFDFYLEILNATQQDRFDQVILTDVRDVVFQKPVSEIDCEGELNFFEEEAGFTIKNCPYNSQWISRLYGSYYLDYIGHENVSNVSIIIGTLQKVKKYCIDMLEFMKSAADVQNGIDMAAHNILCHYHDYPAHRYTNLNGPVWTIGNTPEVTVRKHKFYRNGELPAIVHQYDRHVLCI